MENRYNELNKLLQFEVDRLINALASHGSDVDPHRMGALIKTATERVRELWLKQQAELDAEEAVV